MAFNITKVINGRGPQQLSFSFVLGANGAKPVKAGRAEQANICDNSGSRSMKIVLAVYFSSL
jgi:hypothetical protein